MIHIRGAQLVSAVRDPGRYPDRSAAAVGQAPEVAFAGRSNVGKSSLINMLVARRGLARASKTPGRTRELHFYAVDTTRGPIVFVDFPGYGYARVSKAEHAAWGPLAEGYMTDRRLLRAVVLVVDARRGLEAEEEELLAYLEHHGRAAIVAVTKIDKLAAARQRDVVRSIGCRTTDVPVVAVSSRTAAGRVELWRELGALAFGG